MSYEELIKLESTKQSGFSPCPISEDEKIARVLFSPKHYDNGEILAAAFSQVLYGSGMSTLRLKYDFDNSLEKTITLLQKSDENKYAGYVCANVQDVRALMIENLRLFYVLDTAREDRIGHADIYSMKEKYLKAKDKTILPPKGFQKYIRSKISNVFNELTIK